ncbi:MAG: hypothetical protein U0744_21985, partial [Gemmataceae bacterium]
PIRFLAWAHVGNTLLSIGKDSQAKVWRGPADPSAYSTVEIASLRYEGGDSPVVGRGATAVLVAAPSADPPTLQFRVESGGWLDASDGRASLGRLKSESNLVQLREARGARTLPDSACRIAAEVDPLANWKPLSAQPLVAEQAIVSLAVSEDGKILTGDDSGNIRCWVKDELYWNKPKAHKGPVQSLAIYRGRKVASCGRDKLILWDLDKMQANASFDLTPYGGGTCVAYMPNGAFADPSDTFGRLRVLSNAVVCGTTKGAWLSANEHKPPIALSRNPHSSAVVWAKVVERGADAPHVLTAGTDGIRVRTIFDRVGDLVKFRNEPFTLVDAANGFVATASENGRRLVLFDGRTSKTLVLPQGNLQSLSFAENGEMLAGGTQTGALALWRTRDGKLLDGTRKFKGPIAALIWRGGKLYVASGAEVHVLGESN